LTPAASITLASHPDAGNLLPTSHLGIPSSSSALALRPVAPPLPRSIPKPGGGSGGPPPSYLDTTANYATPSPLTDCDGRPQRGDVKDCRPSFRVMECACGRVLVPFGSCMAGDCTTCADAVGSRRAAKASARLEARRDGRPVLQTVLTVPLDLRHTVADPKAWMAAVRAFITYLKREHGFDGGLEATHPTGDDPEVWHPHANILWVQCPGVSPYLDVDALRDAWAKVLGAKGPVVLHHTYVQTVSKIRHRIRYVTRSFPGWRWWTPNLRWFGSMRRKLQDEEVEDEDHLCLKCGQKRACVGVVSYKVAKKWEDLGEPDGWLDRYLPKGRGPP